MPRQVRYFIRTALGSLLAAFVVGGLVLINQGLTIDGRIGILLPVFYHLLMVGWATQLICGVALWMFPHASRERPRGDERLGWFTYAALNTGLLLYVSAITSFVVHAARRMVSFRMLPRPNPNQP